ncbi:hypothetical protein OSTOST_10198 [Ostertagia ostertagi]
MCFLNEVPFMICDYDPYDSLQTRIEKTNFSQEQKKKKRKSLKILEDIGELGGQIDGDDEQGAGFVACSC